MTPGDSRRERVVRVLDVARNVASPTHPLGQEARAALRQTTGLSAEGVERALTRHLETSARAEDIDRLLASVGAARRCHVVLASNVCTAAFRAVALAVATAPIVAVRPSRRDPTLASLLVRELGKSERCAKEDGSVTIVTTVSATARDEVHLYGSDESLAEVRRGLDPGVIVRSHGTGFGVAVVGESVALDVAAQAIAEDVIPFDQRGCLSPRIVLLEGGQQRGESFVEALHAALTELGEECPRGVLAPTDSRDIALYAATMEASGAFLSGTHHAIGYDPKPRALTLAPAMRVVHVAMTDTSSVGGILGPLSRYLTAIGSNDKDPLTEAVVAMAPFARRSGLGAMQRPPLDGPVDRRPTSAPHSARDVEGRISPHERQR